MLLPLYNLLLSWYPADVVGSFRLPWYIFTYALLSTALCVNRIPRKAMTYTSYAGCGIPGCCEVCCAVCTPLCGGRCAACLCCSLFFCCRDFAFSNVHDMFVRNKQKRVRAHPSIPVVDSILCHLFYAKYIFAGFFQGTQFFFGLFLFYADFPLSSHKGHKIRIYAGSA